MPKRSNRLGTPCRARHWTPAVMLGSINLKYEIMNRNVLITAGAGGIGLEIAKAFAEIGDRVYVCDIDKTALENSKQTIPNVVTGLCDVSDRESVEKMVAHCAESLGGIDILVNNAGIAGPTAPVEEIEPEAWEKVMEVDLNAIFNVTRSSTAHLKKLK